MHNSFDPRKSYIPSSYKTMSWCDLPNDLLSAIFHILTNDICYWPDLYQCLHVCSSWRHMAKRLLHSSAAPVPWLLMPRQEPHKLVFDTSLYDSHNKTSIAFDESSSSILSLSLPVEKDQSFSDHKIIALASHHGWLLLGPKTYRSPDNLDDLEHPVFLYNPLSRVLIKLPPLPSHLRLNDCVQFVMSETSPRDPKCIVCVLINTQVLAFCKPSQGAVLSSSLWVLSEKPTDSEFHVVSMIFHKGSFYTMDDECALYVHRGITDFIINDDSDTANMRRTWPWGVIENKVALSTYNENLPWLIQLVESKNGELLMVERTCDERQREPPFIVYKLTIRGSYQKQNWGSDENHCEYYWKEVDRLEENEALYFGANDSVSISVNVSDGNHMDTYKPNCIYYLIEVGDELDCYGVYNLEDNSVVQLWLDDDYDDGPSSCRLFAPSIP